GRLHVQHHRVRRMESTGNGGITTSGGASNGHMATRAKIVCTLGPSSHSREGIRQMIEAGMNVTRHNFSHGTHEDHTPLIQTVRAAAKDAGRVVGIMADLQGPKVRVGRFRDGQVTLPAGGAFVITSRAIEGTSQEVSTTYTGLPQDVRAGDTLLLDD